MYISRFTMESAVYSVVFTVLCLSGYSSGHSEVVWLEAASPLHRLRGLGGGLPNVLEIRLKRGKDTIKLKLEENIQIHANAPLYELKTLANGEQRLVKKETKPIQNVGFYQDKEHMGTFTIRCQQDGKQTCKRLLTGNFFLEGINYDIHPAPAKKTDRFNRLFSLGHPHVLVRNDIPADYLQSRMKSVKVEDGILPPSIEFPKISGARRGLDRRSYGKKPTRGLTKALLNEWKKMLQTVRKSLGGQKTDYFVETFVLIDPALWEEHYARVAATNPPNVEIATEERIREYFSHIMNGVDLRYSAIEDPQMRISVILSGFLILQNRSEDNPYPPSKLINIEGVEHADAKLYIEGVQTWVQKHVSQVNADHVFLFTGYEFYDAESQAPSDAVGVAYLSAICSNFRTSINEEHGHDYWIMTSVAAHELAHNLGADHDSNESPGCITTDETAYIMSPYVPSANNPDSYSINPYRFSQCSIDAMKSNFQNLESENQNCLLDEGNYFNETAYNIHITKLPGEIYPLNVQCVLLLGDGSEPCSNVTDEGICARLLCSIPDDPNSCRPFVAAQGTACGEPGNNKWCFEGLCQSKKVTETPSITPEVTTMKPTPEVTTMKPTPEATTMKSTPEATSPTSSYTETTNKDQGQCKDTGYDGVSCSEIEDYYNDDGYESFCDTYGSECCETCREKGNNNDDQGNDNNAGNDDNPDQGQCKDTGYNGASCSEIEDYYNDNGLESFCDFFESECCETCLEKGNGNDDDQCTTKQGQCKDTGYYGVSCSDIEDYYNDNGYESFCDSFGSDCCETCFEKGNGNDDDQGTTRNQNHSPRCVDKGLRYYDCDTMYSWYKNRGQTLQEFCSDYKSPCCLTCASGGFLSEPTTMAPVTETQCQDTGFLNYNCNQMRLWYNTFQQFCASNEEYCCHTCKNQIEVCEDPGFLSYSCKTLQRRLRSKRKLCKTYKPYCCKTCSS